MTHAPCLQYYARTGAWERACDLYAQSDRPIAHVLSLALNVNEAAKPLVGYFDAVLFDADLGESLLVDDVADQVRLQITPLSHPFPFADACMR